MTCSQKIFLVHTKGHQDKNKTFDELTFPAQLNVLMDNLSKKMVLDTADDTNNIIPLPAQMSYLCIKNPVVHDLSNTLIANEMKNEIKTYYEKHHDIPQTSFQHVDWEANKLAMSTASEISYRKTFHNLQNTMTINKKWK